MVIFITLNSCKQGQQKAKEAEWTNQGILEHVQDWPGTSKKAAEYILNKYGLPDEVTEYRLKWHNKGNFQEIVVHKEEVEHNFPMPHTDVLEQSVYYDVPIDKMDEITAFNGSLIIHRTKGIMSARCENEHLNYLILNLAHEIAVGERTVEDARGFFGTNVMAYLLGDTSLFMHDFLFTPAQKSGFPDESVIDDEFLGEIGEN